MSDSTDGIGWRQRPTGFLASIVAVVVIVVLVGGIALGYEIEKSRVKTHRAKSAGVTTPTKSAPRVTRIIGAVTASTPNVISITLKSGAKRNVTMAKGTVVVRAGSGTASDISANERVVYVSAGSPTKVAAVIVLPKTARLGSLVSTANATTMSVEVSKAKVVKITTTGATVDKVSPATLADVTKGSKVLVQIVRTKTGVLVATEIIVLPGNSAFQ
jgi:hypothetical protein